MKQWISVFALGALAVCAACASGPLPEGAGQGAGLERFRGEGNPWGASAPALFEEYVAPKTSIGEPEVDWLPVLEPVARELAAGAPDALEAARRINRGLWDRIGVHYSPKRDRPDQDPLHSMRIGMASCSGLSILLADACRSVGIPARVVGCFWRLKPGNHSWVEVWSGGAWHALGAAEDCAPEALWFLDDAAAADADDPRYAIYAARASLPPEGTRFFGWGVPAENVTARYARKAGEGVKVHIAAERNGVRVATPFRVDGVEYVTPGPERDLNDYTTLTFPSNGVFTLEMAGRRLERRAEPGVIYVERLP